MRRLGQVIVMIAFTALGLAACEPAPDIETTKPTAGGQELTQSPPAAIEAQVPTVVFLGDSLTAGFNLAPQEALPEQISLRLNAAVPSVKIINAGVSGDTSANGLARYDWSVGSVNPDFLILALGANDYLQDIPPLTTRANLSEILNTAKAEDISVILVGLKPRSKTAPESRDANFGAIYPQLAEQFDVPLYPALLEGVRNNPDLLQADGLHPTAKGVKKMADGLAPFLSAIIE